MWLQEVMPKVLQRHVCKDLFTNLLLVLAQLPCQGTMHKFCVQQHVKDLPALLNMLLLLLLSGAAGCVRAVLWHDVRLPG
jgi:hypothetical protein